MNSIEHRTLSRLLARCAELHTKLDREPHDPGIRARYVGAVARAKHYQRSLHTTGSRWLLAIVLLVALGGCADTLPRAEACAEQASVFCAERVAAELCGQIYGSVCDSGDGDIDVDAQDNCLDALDATGPWDEIPDECTSTWEAGL